MSAYTTASQKNCPGIVVWTVIWGVGIWLWVFEGLWIVFSAIWWARWLDKALALKFWY